MKLMTSSNHFIEHMVFTLFKFIYIVINRRKNQYWSWKPFRVFYKFYNNMRIVQKQKQNNKWNKLFSAHQWQAAKPWMFSSYSLVLWILQKSHPYRAREHHILSLPKKPPRYTSRPPRYKFRELQRVLLKSLFVQSCDLQYEQPCWELLFTIPIFFNDVRWWKTYKRRHLL